MKLKGRSERGAFLWSALLAALFAQSLLWSNPAAPDVARGAASFATNGNQLIITQGTDRAVINWDSFSIDSGEITQFIQPGEASAVLNRVRGVDPSVINGQLLANGRVFLLNSNGILIGPSGFVDTAGFVASTLDVSDDQFMSGGDLDFRGTSTASVVNLGTIKASAGDVILIGANVRNEGTILAPRGTVGLAGGQDVILMATGDERIKVRTGTGQVINQGVIEANMAELRAHHGNVGALAIRNEGRVAATGITEKGGRILLSAGGGGKIVNSAAGQLEARTTEVTKAKIVIDAGEGEVEAGGGIDASSETGEGGYIAILGNRLTLPTGALIIADGESGGGEIYVGGGRRGLDPNLANAENVSVEEGAKISVNAIGAGDGGTGIVFAERSLDFFGAISARGGQSSGDGGFIELSGKYDLRLDNIVEQVNVSAPIGSGGSLLIDPRNIWIVKGSNADPPPINNDNGTTFTDSQINGFLNHGNLTIDAAVSEYSHYDSGTSRTEVLGAINGNDGDITIEKGALISWNNSSEFSINAAGSFIHEGEINATKAGMVSVTAGDILINGGTIKSPGGTISLTALGVETPGTGGMPGRGLFSVVDGLVEAKTVAIQAGKIDLRGPLIGGEVSFQDFSDASITLGKPSDTLFYINDGNIFRSDKNDAFYDGSEPVTNLTIDQRRGRIYWIEGSELKQADLDGSNPQPLNLVNSGGVTGSGTVGPSVAPGSLAFDQDSNTLWVRFDEGGISKIGGFFLGRDVPVLDETIDAGSPIPSSGLLTFDPVNDTLFWNVNNGTNSRIAYRKLGESGNQVLQPDTTNSVNSLAVDSSGNLYVGAGTVVRKFDRISEPSGDYYRNVSKTVYNGSNDITSLAVDGENGLLYYTDSGGLKTVDFNGASVSNPPIAATTDITGHNLALTRSITDDGFILSNEELGFITADTLTIGDGSTDVTIAAPVTSQFGHLNISGTEINVDRSITNEGSISLSGSSLVISDDIIANGYYRDLAGTVGDEFNDSSLHILSGIMIKNGVELFGAGEVIIENGFRVNGEPDSEIVVEIGSDQRVEISGPIGLGRNDRLVLSGQVVDANGLPNNRDIEIIGTPRDDRFTLNTKVKRVEGMSGFDTLSYESSSGPVSVHSRDIRGIEKVIGSNSFGDTLRLSDINNSSGGNYAIFEDRASKNGESIYFENFENLQVRLGRGDDSVATGFYSFDQLINGGGGQNTITINGTPYFTDQSPVRSGNRTVTLRNFGSGAPIRDEITDSINAAAQLNLPVIDIPPPPVDTIVDNSIDSRPPSPEPSGSVGSAELMQQSQDSASPPGQTGNDFATNPVGGNASDTTSFFDFGSVDPSSGVTPNRGAAPLSIGGGPPAAPEIQSQIEGSLSTDVGRAMNEAIGGDGIKIEDVDGSTSIAGQDGLPPGEIDDAMADAISDEVQLEMFAAMGLSEEIIITRPRSPASMKIGGEGPPPAIGQLLENALGPGPARLLSFALGGDGTVPVEPGDGGIPISGQPGSVGLPANLDEAINAQTMKELSDALRDL